MHKDLEALSKVIAAMQDEIDRLNLALVRSRETSEDIAIGQKIVCVCCNQWKPCMCDKK